MSRNCLGSTHQGRSGAVRLVRLAAVTCLALAAGSAAVWAQTTGDLATGHRCIHGEVQQRVLQSVAQEHDNLGTLSAVGLPSVAAAPDLASVRGTVDYAVADSTSLQVERFEGWGQLRITVSTEVLTGPEVCCTQDMKESINHEKKCVGCKEDKILTDEKRDILMNSIIPEAVQLHTDRLKVRQVQSNWTVKDLGDSYCEYFNVPKAHVTSSFNNTDFLLYVASDYADPYVVPLAATCQVFPDGRPAVGFINIPASKIVSRYDQRVIRTAAHQIAHALGFDKRFFRSAGITKHVTKIRGMSGNFTVINGSKTVEKAREHYGCESLAHLEMENNSLTDWVNSHLKMRNAKDELMAPEVGAGYYSALTMAIFEDMGFYKADFSKAEVMPWGRNASCEFLDQKCMEKGITQWPQMFCNNTQMLRCTSSRLEMGVCDVHTHNTSLDEYYRYFTNETLGGNTSYMDYCPYVKPAGEGACNQNSSTASGLFGEFNVFSDSARCIDGTFTPKNKSTDSRPISGTCANVKCDNTTQTYSIQVKGSRSYVKCTEGQKITLDNVSDAFEAGGYITCPPYAEVCQGNVKAAMDFEADLRKNRGTSSSSERGHTPTDSLPSSGQGDTPTDSLPSSGQGHTPTDSLPSSGRGHIPTDSMPSSSSGANKPDATASNGKGDRLFPLGNGAAGLHSAGTLVSAGVALLMVTLTVGLSA